MFNGLLRQGGAGVQRPGGSVFGNSTTSTGGAIVATGPVRAGPSVNAIGRGNSVARPANMPDYDWLFGAKSAAANGMTATTTIVGNPNTYTYATNGWTLDKSRGQPWYMGGLFTSLTKPSGGQVVGAWSYGGDANCAIAGFISDPMWSMSQCNGGQPVAFAEGEVLTNYVDNNNTNEQGCDGTLWCYGKPGHKYPQSIEELLRVSGLKYRELWEPIVTVTPSVTVLSGGNAISTGATGTKWLDGSSQYYILGVQPQSVLTGSGFINIAGGLPDYMKVRNNIIPFGDSKNAAVCEPAKPSFPYWPIGPFTSANMPILSALGTVANAQLVKMFIAKC